MNGAPGMPFDAMAQLRPCFFSVLKASAPTSSTEPQPRALATWHTLSSDHFSPALWKHQAHTDCLTRPLRLAGLSSASAAAVAARPASAVLRVIMSRLRGGAVLAVSPAPP